MPRTIIQYLTLCRTASVGINSQLLCDVRDLLAIGLECTGGQGTALRGATITHMPNGGMYAPPRKGSSRVHSPCTFPHALNCLPCVSGASRAPRVESP
jgi:hypothetical protein